jgi:hypothetical protein
MVLAPLVVSAGTNLRIRFSARALNPQNATVLSVLTYRSAAGVSASRLQMPQVSSTTQAAFHPQRENGPAH